MRGTASTWPGTHVPDLRPHAGLGVAGTVVGYP